MIINNPEVQAWLDTGNCLVVPSAQRAAAVRLAHAAEHFANREALWASPDVLPWNAWVAQQRAGAASVGGASLRQPSATEDWLMWRAAVRAASDDLELLNPDSLVDAVRASSRLADEWDLNFGASTAEAELLHRARRIYRQRCQQLGMNTADDWLPGDTPLTRPTWVLGFAELGGAHRHALLARGARIGWQRTEPAPPDALPSVARTVVAANVDAECDLVAAWCRKRLDIDPLARLLVVVPRSGEQLPRLRRTLSEALGSHSAPAVAGAEPLVAYEGGALLAEYPLVAAGLAILRCATGLQPFAEWSCLLRSPYLDVGGWRWRASFERWLRAHNLTEFDWLAFRRLRVQCQPVPPAAALASLDQSQAQLATGSAAAGEWIGQFAALLQQAGWPGPVELGSSEQQVRMRFEELLGEVAAAQDVAGHLSAGDVVALLEARAQRTGFEVANADAPVTVTVSNDDPLVRYDGIWVLGLSADAWPAAANRDSFVPYAAQAEKGISWLSAAGQQQVALAAMRAWEQASVEVIYSWPKQLDDAVLEASPLLPTDNSAGESLKPYRSGLLQLAAPLEPCESDRAQQWPAGLRARDGVRLIQAQAQCPFQASAIGRLRCEPLAWPLDGITPQLHGQLVHRALQLLWEQVGDQDTLSKMRDAWQALLRRHVEQAVLEYRQRELLPLPATVWLIERQRCEAVLERLLVVEAEREPFTVMSTEQQLETEIGGLPLRMRRDRVDLLHGAEPRVLIIDYKTGKAAASIDWQSARPGETQLLCYALDAGEELCGIASLHVHSGGISYRGVTDQTGRLPGVRPLRDLQWAELRRLWQRNIHALGAAYVAGEAAVAPLKRACERCHLALLCRINADQLVDDEPSEADSPESSDE